MTPTLNGDAHGDMIPVVPNTAALRDGWADCQQLWIAESQKAARLAEQLRRIVVGEVTEDGGIGTHPIEAGFNLAAAEIIAAMDRFGGEDVTDSLEFDWAGHRFTVNVTPLPDPR